MLKLIPLISFCLILSLISNNLFSQTKISVDSPVENGVYQRNNEGTAQVAIFGKVDPSLKIDKIQYQIFDYRFGKYDESNWKNIENIKIDSTYFGVVTMPQGWYNYEIRFISEGKVIEQKKLERIGVGEVFIIVGQSNAAGDPNTGIVEPYDERIITLTNYYKDFDQPFDINPKFAKMTREGYIGPSGRTAWLWGQLGDKLVSRLQVPVLFLNASFNGTSVSMWARTQEASEKNPNQYPAPYGTVLNTVLRFGNEFGVRSVLWFQGEADNFGRTGTSPYFNDLKNFIQSIRKETKKPRLAYTIARTSYGLGRSSPEVILAQNDIINAIPDVWAGPESDLIIGRENRSDDLHFSGQGLPLIAEAWNQSLTDNFFKYCVVTSSIPESVKYRNPSYNYKYNDKCFSTFVNFTPNIEKTNIKWSHETSSEYSNSKKISQNGTYWYSVDNENFRSINSNQTYIEFNAQPAAPEINFVKKSLFCEGDTIVFSSTAKNLVWNNNIETDKLFASKSGIYSLKQKLENGCFTKSDSVTINIVKPLEKIKISPEINDFSICAGDSIVVKTNNIVENILWSTGSTKPQIILKTTGDFWVNYLKSNGCPTENTNFNLKTFLRPVKPEIIRENGITLKADSDGQKYFWYKDEISQTTNENRFTTYKSGIYKVYAENNYKISDKENLICKSELSNNYSVTILANETFENSIEIGPNPLIGGVLNVKIDNLKGKHLLKLTDLTGKILFTTELTNTKTIINLPADFAKGTFLLKIIGQHTNHSSKIVLW